MLEMRRIFGAICIVILFASCQRESKVRFVDAFPNNGSLVGVEHYVYENSGTPVNKMAVFQHNLLIASISRKVDEHIFRLYHLPDLSLLTGFGMRGHGHNEFVTLDFRQMQMLDDGFMVLDPNRSQMVCISYDGSQFNVDEDRSYHYQPEYQESMMNGNMFVNEETSISWTNIYAGSNYEYELWNIPGKHMVKSFGHWPKWVFIGETLPHLVYMKSSVLSGDKRRFASFYVYFRHWRLFTTGGRLIKELHLEMESFNELPKRPSERKTYYYTQPLTIGDRIFVLCRNNISGHSDVYLEVWNWEGDPIARYQLDRELDHFAIEGNVMYGVDNSNIYEDGVMKIIEYKLPTEVIGQ